MTIELVLTFTHAIHAETLELTQPMKLMKFAKTFLQSLTVAAGTRTTETTLSLFVQDRMHAEPWYVDHVETQPDENIRVTGWCLQDAAVGGGGSVNGSL